MQISIIIPAYNEEKRLPETIEKILFFLKKERKTIDTYEIIIVDDASTDKTREKIEKIKKENEENKRTIHTLTNKINKGKGYSVKQGLLVAKYPYSLFMDADLSTPIEELKTCLPYTKEYDIIIGSRNLPKSKKLIKQPRLRSTLGRIFPWVVDFMLKLNIKDTQCGFKLLNKKAVRLVIPKLTINRFAFDVELLYIARKQELKIKEFPVTWINAEGSKVHPIRDGLQMFRDVMIIKRNDKKGCVYE